jgi:hypothetical protein
MPSIGDVVEDGGGSVDLAVTLTTGSGVPMSYAMLSRFPVCSSLPTSTAAATTPKTKAVERHRVQIATEIILGGGVRLLEETTIGLF